MRLHKTKYYLDFEYRKMQVANVFLKRFLVNEVDRTQPDNRFSYSGKIKLIF